MPLMCGFVKPCDQQPHPSMAEPNCNGLSKGVSRESFFRLAGRSTEARGRLDALGRRVNLSVAKFSEGQGARFWRIVVY